MTTKVIKLEARNVYGQVKLYPANKEAETIALVLGTKTVDPNKVALLAHAFGAEVVVVNESLAHVVVRDSLHAEFFQHERNNSDAGDAVRRHLGIR